MKMHCLHLLIVFFTVGKLFGQSFDDSKDPRTELETLRQKILEESTVGEKYFFDFTGIKECNLSCMSYLGELTNTNGDRFKVLTSFYVNGQSCRGTSRIVIYNSDHVYLGNYYVSLPEELPKKIRNNELVFARAKGSGKYMRRGKITFADGNPDAITFSNGRKEQEGDYFFSKEE